MKYGPKPRFTLSLWFALELEPTEWRVRAWTEGGIRKWRCWTGRAWCGPLGLSLTVSRR